MNKNDIFISERLLLRGVCLLDTDDLVRWRSNAMVNRYFRQSKELTVAEHLQWYQAYCRNHCRYDFMIIERGSGRGIGTVGVNHINRAAASCEISYMIAESCYRRRGYAAEAIKMMMKVMTEQGIYRFYAEIHIENIASVRTVEKLGFQLFIKRRPFSIYRKECIAAKVVLEDSDEMEDKMNYHLIRRVLMEQLDKGIKDFIIFPYSEMGMLVKNILNNSFGIQEKLIIDNTLCKYNPDIKGIQFFIRYVEEHPEGNEYILFASRNAALFELMKTHYDETKIIRFETELAKRGKYSTGPLVEDPLYEDRLSFGNFCNFALGTAAVWNHQLNMVTQHGFIFSSDYCCIDNQQYKWSDFNQRFEIGHDVWLGRNVILTNGIKIGNGVRAAAGSVITKDIPDYAIIAGVPARIIGYRFSPEEIAKLNEIAWWDWPIEKIKNCYEDFLDIKTFLAKHYPPPPRYNRGGCISTQYRLSRALAPADYFADVYDMYIIVFTAVFVYGIWRIDRL